MMGYLKGELSIWKNWNFQFSSAMLFDFFNTILAIIEKESVKDFPTMVGNLAANLAIWDRRC